MKPRLTSITTDHVSSISQLKKIYYREKSNLGIDYHTQKDQGVYNA